MAAHNRHLRDDREEILVPIHGNTVVEAGDFMAHNGTAGMTGAGVAIDGYAFPFSYVVNSASPGTGIRAACYNNFIGVAMESSESGVTENISVATAGVFRYPIYSTTAVTIGATVSAVSTPSSAVGVSAQCVAIPSASKSTTAYLGRIVKTESGASFVDFEIRTLYNGLSSA